MKLLLNTSQKSRIDYMLGVLYILGEEVSAGKMVDLGKTKIGK